jgi:sulfur-carrier protein
MTITVLFFGVLSEVTGTGTRFYNGLANLDELKLRIADDYPGIEHYSFRISVNNEITDESCDLKDGDEVAFLPPFAGG